MVHLASSQLRTNSVKMSICPSIQMSVCHTFFIMFLSSYHHEIFMSYYKSDVHAKDQGQRSKRFLDCNSNLNSHMAMKWCTNLAVALKRCPIDSWNHQSNFKVTWTEKWTILTQIVCFQIITPVWIHRWLQNNAQTLKWYRKGTLLFFKVICQMTISKLWFSNILQYVSI